MVTLVVKNTNDSGEYSLAEAISIANNNVGTKYIITFESGLSGNITVSNLTVNSNCDVTIQGNVGAENEALITLTNTGTQLFHVAGDIAGCATVTVENMRFSGGYASNGGAISNQGDLTLRNCDFTNNYAAAYGGVIFSYGSATNLNLLVENCTFSNNSAGITGGGIAVNNGTATINNSDFRQNSSIFGGAVYNYTGTIYVNDSNFYDNHAIGNGIWAGKANGGAINITAGNAFVTGGTFANNTADNTGGAIDINQGKLVVTGSEFNKNHADHFGGAINNDFADSTISGSVFEENYADGGGAIDNINSGRLTLGENDYINNSGFNFGGGVIRIGDGTIIDGYLSNGNDVYIGTDVTVADGEKLNVLFDLTKALKDAYMYHNLKGLTDFNDTGKYSYTVIVAGVAENWSYNLANGATGFESDVRVTVDDVNGKVLGYVSLQEDLTVYDDKGIPMTRYQLLLDTAGNLTLTVSDVRPVDEPVKWYSKGVRVSQAVLVDATDEQSVYYQFTVNPGDPQKPYDLMTVSATGKTIGVTIKGGGEQRIFEGGVAATTILDGGTQYIFALGTATGTVVQSGGTQIIQANTTVSDTKLYSDGTVLLNEGAVLSGLTVNGGTFLTVNMTGDTPLLTQLSDVVFADGNTGTSVFTNVWGVKLEISRNADTGISVLIQDKALSTFNNHDIMTIAGDVVIAEEAEKDFVINNTGTMEIQRVFNRGSGHVQVANTGTFDATLIQNEGSGAIAIVNGTAQSAGTITFSGQIVPTLIGSLKLALYNNGPDDITLQNTSGSVTFHGGIYNAHIATGDIHVINHDQMTIAANEDTPSIANRGAGSVSIENSGTFTADSVRNEGSGTLRVDNYSRMVFNGRLITAAGEPNAFRSAIHSSSDRNTSVSNGIGGNLQVNGAIISEAAATGNIDIVNDGIMSVRSLDASGNSYTSILNKGSGSISITNAGSFSADTIRNESGGAITITNDQTFTLNSRLVDGRKLSIWSNGSGSDTSRNMLIENHSGMSMAGAIRSETNSTGNIEIVNTGTLSILDKIIGDREIEHDTTQAAISNNGKGYISIVNGGTGSNGYAGFVSGAIDNFGLGQLFFANTLNCHAYVGATGLEHIGAGWNPADGGFSTAEWAAIIPSLGRYLAGQSYSIGVISKGGSHVPGFNDATYILNNGRMTLDEMIFSISDSDLVIQNGAGSAVTAGVISIGSGQTGAIAVINLYGGDIVMGGLDASVTGGVGVTYGTYQIQGDIVNAAHGDIVLGGIAFAADSTITTSEYNKFDIQGNIYNESVGHIYIGLADGSVIGALNAGYEIRNLVSLSVNSIVIDMRGQNASGIKIYSDVIGEQIFITGDGSLYGRISGGEVDPSDVNAKAIVSIDGQASAPIQVNNTVSGVWEESIAGSTDVTIHNATVNAAIIGGGDGVNVGGNVNLTVTNVTANKNIYGGGYNGNVAGSIALSITADTQGGNRLYGGGRGSVGAGLVDVTGPTIAVDIGAGTYVTHVFGGTDSDTSSTAAKTVYGDISLTVGTGATIQGMIFGGGFRNGPAGTDVTTGKTVMNFGGATITNMVYGGGFSYNAVLGKQTTYRVDGGTEMSFRGTLFTANSYAIYGGGLARGVGATTVLGTLDDPKGVSIHGSEGAELGFIYGGGFAESNGVSVVYGDSVIAVENSVSYLIHGGGNTKGGNAINYGTSQITVTNSKTDYIYGGGLATSKSKTAVTAGSDIKVFGSDLRNIAIYGGGSAYGIAGYGSVSVVGADLNEAINPAGIGANIAIDKDTTVKLIYGGGFSAHANTRTAVYGGVNISVNGGKVLEAIYGGGYSYGNGVDSSGAYIYGDTRITIHGGEVGLVFGGGDNDLAGTAVNNGNTHILLNCRDSALTVNGNIYGGGRAGARVTGNTRIEFTGLGSNLTMNGYESAPLSVVYGDSTRRDVVDGVRNLVFSDFNGAISATFGYFDAVSITGNSSVEWATAQHGLADVKTWDFEVFNGRNTLDWQTGSNDFTNDTMNLTFDEASFGLDDQATVIRGGAAAVIHGWSEMSSVTFNDIHGNFVGGVWIDDSNKWQLSANGNSDLILTKIA